MKKKITLAILTIFILLAGSTTVFAYNNATNYVSIDINPSVEISVNMFDYVVSVEATNEDGVTLLEGLDLINMPVDQAVALIMEKATAMGYIADDGTTVVSVITETEDEDLQDKVSNGVSLVMSNKSLIAPLYVDSSSPEMRAEAKALGVSPGKYKLIKTLQAIDPTINVEDYKDAKVSAIVRKANELLIANGFEGKADDDMEGLVDNLEKVSDEIDEDEGQDVDQDENEGQDAEQDEDIDNDEDGEDNGAQNQDKINTNNKNKTKIKHNKESLLYFYNLYV